jgi:hypothetical protein
MHYRQRESSSHSGIHRVAAGLHHFGSGSRRQFVNAHNDAVLSVNRLRGAVSAGWAKHRAEHRHGRHQQQNQ